MVDGSMTASVSVLALFAILTLAIFLALLNFFYWRAERTDPSTLWLAGWLVACALFAVCRLLQYAALSDRVYTLLPRLLLSVGYSLAWLGYEFGNTFANYRPPRAERALVIALTALPILLLWTGGLVLTDQIVMRSTLFGGAFHGALNGPLYLPASFVILALGLIPPIRLLRTREHQRENRLLALGFLFVILFSLNDFIATSLNIVWLRLSDFSYLPVAFFFSFIQTRRFGLLVNNLSGLVSERSAALLQANAELQAEIVKRREAESALSQTMRRLMVLLDNLQTGILFEDESRNIALANQTLCELFHSPRSPAELTGLASEVFAQATKQLMADPQAFSQRIQAVIEGQQMVSAEELHLADGRTFERDYIPISVENNLIGHLWQYRDISGRKKAEEAVKESEEQYRSLLEHSLYGVVVHIQGKVVFVNPTAVKLIGAHNSQELLGKPILDFVHPDSRAAVVQRLKEMGAGNEVPALEERFVCLDGKVIDVEVIAYPFPYQRQSAVQVVFRDITDRKRAEAVIRRQADEMKALYETTHDLVMERSLSDLLHTVVKRAVGLLNATSGGLYLCDPSQRQVRCEVSYNTPQDYRGVVLKYGEGAAGLVAETGQPLIIPDYRVWAGRAAVYEGENTFVSMVSVPMVWQNQVLGVLHVIDYSKPQAYHEEDLLLLTQFADQAAIAVGNARLFEFEEQRRREAAAIAEIDRDISASLQVNVVLEKIASHAKELLRAETSAVYLADAERPGLWAIAAQGPDADEIKQDPVMIGKGILGNIAARKVGEIVNDAARDERSINIKGTAVIPFDNLVSVPILRKGELIGLIAAWRTGQTQGFTPTELDFLKSLAGQAAIAIVNANLFEAEQKRRKEAETLRSAAQKITSTLDQNQVIQLILEQLANVLPFESASVQLLREGYLEVVGGQGWSDPAGVLGMRFPIPGDNPNSAVVLERRPLILHSAPQAYPSFNRPPHTSIQSWLGVPLIVRDRVIGMVAVDHSQPGFFRDTDVQMVTALAGQAALAIDNARLFKDTQQRLVELEILQTMASALRIAQTVDEVFPIILDQLIHLLDFGSALVDLIDPLSGEIVSVLAEGAWAPMTGKRTPIDKGGSGRVIAAGQPYVTHDLMADGFVAWPNLIGGLNSAACVPIVANQQSIGTLWVGRQSQSHITHEEVNLLIALGEMVGNTLQRMRLHEQTVRQTEEITLAYDLTLEGWAKALELRDKETEGHSRRVTDLTLQLARQFGFDETELVHIRRGVLLHDIGKMGISDQILKKPSALSDEEWIEMHKHPQYAYDLIYPITYLRPALDIPYCHHEKWDGSGYPRGLRGEQIPLAARIFALVDVFDALSNDRLYRSAWPREQALAYLVEQSGKHFDPRVVQAALEILADTPESAH